MNTQDVLQHLSVDKWVDTADLATLLRINTRQVGQRAGALFRAGSVLRSDTKPYSYRLAVPGDSEDSALALLDDAQVAEPAPFASFAIWDDGTLSVVKGEVTANLDIEDVKRLITFVTRFR